MLVALHGLIDVDHKHNAVILRRDVVELNNNLLVIALAGAGQIIAQVLHRPGAVGQIAEKDDIIPVQQLSAPQHNGRSVAVDVLVGAAGEQAAQQAALLLGLIPAQTDDHTVQTLAALFGKADFLTLLQAD